MYRRHSRSCSRSRMSLRIHTLHDPRPRVIFRSVLVELLYFAVTIRIVTEPPLHGSVISMASPSNATIGVV